MNKIAIIGCCGAGKTFLSLALGKRLQIHVHHLDAIYWKPNWVESKMSEFQMQQEKIIAQDQWILDGNYGKTMDIRLQYADTIIFLDIATSVCIWSILKRYFRYRNKTRIDMGGDNTEHMTFEFLFYTWSFRRKNRSKIMEKLNTIQQSKNVIILKSRKDVNAFINVETII